MVDYSPHSLSLSVRVTTFSELYYVLLYLLGLTALDRLESNFTMF